MRILLPNGSVLTAEKAIAVCEQRVAFNGRDMRLCEKAVNSAYANGVAFFSGAHGSFDVVTGGVILLGNLSNEFAREVLTSLVRQGYVDLSDLKLQKEQSPATCYVFDNGKSEAYILRGFDADMSCADVFGYPFVGGPFPPVGATEDADEDDAEDEDAGEEDCNE